MTKIIIVLVCDESLKDLGSVPSLSLDPWNFSHYFELICKYRSMFVMLYPLHFSERGGGGKVSRWLLSMSSAI